MSTKCKSYKPAEKAKIALAAIKGELTLAEISSRYHTSKLVLILAPSILSPS